MLYLGGILIFFLFTALMLNNEYTSNKSTKQYSLENMFLILISIKLLYLISYLNYNVCVEKTNTITQFIPTYITNGYFFNDFLNNQSDVSSFIVLFSEKYILLFILGFILLFTMMGVIVITKK